MCWCSYILYILSYQINIIFKRKYRILFHIFYYYSVRLYGFRFTHNNYNNRVVGPPKGKVLEGQPPRYSNQQQRFFKLFIKHNNDILEQNKYRDDNNEFEWKYNDSYDYYV